MVRPLSDHLRRSLKLRTLSTDRLLINNHGSDFGALEIVAKGADAGYNTGVISSWRTVEGDELLHLALETDMEEVMDVVEEDGLPDFTAQRVIRYDLTDGTLRLKIMEDLADPVKQYFTDFSEWVIPIETIEQMRLVDGKSKEEWYQRGVSASENSWAVLLD
jgi:hypothetical protein